MISLRLDEVRSVLCLGAHPDDIEIGCGGTMLKLLEQAQELDIRWVVLSGDETRAEEARGSASRFLKTAARQTVELLEFTDTCFPYRDSHALKETFQDLSRSFRPDLIFTHRRDDAHQDHRLVADLTWQHFRDHMILEYEIPKYEGDLGQPNIFVPLPSKLAEVKIETILSAFLSQHDKPWFKPELLRSLLSIRGIECRSPSNLAEGFYCRKLVLN